MEIKLLQNEITERLISNLKNINPDHQFAEVINYSVFPPGKLFRPLLVCTLAKDLGQITEDHYLLAQAIEVHHTYTLIHDDLPSMDDDNYRRGRESAHIKFSEWQAILSGDSLLNSSYELLSDIKHPKLGNLLKMFTSYTGQRGLILGQVLDLGGEYESLEQILKLHELKTGRLIQLSLKGSALLSNTALSLEIFDEIGLYLGVNFQLLDDLCELTEEINQHEKDINPYLRFKTQDILEIVKTNNYKLKELTETNNLTNLSEYIQTYLDIINKKLTNGIKEVNKHITLSKEDIAGIC
jgi:geranylgeranyl pyrophosphate synthase